MRTVLEFGEWLPDLPALGNPGALEARNVVPAAQSYRPLRSLLPTTPALAERCLNLFWALSDANVVNSFAGGVTALYQLSGAGTWADVSRTVGGAYVANDWEFEKFGQRIIAVNGTDEPQYFVMGTSTNFENLAGAPPIAARVGVVRDFVILGDLQNAPDTVQWSGFNSTELWTPSLATMADRQQLFGRGGRVQKIVSGDVGIVFREHSIHLLRPVGPSLIFENIEVERGRGTPAPNSVVWSGDRVFYYGHDGFYRFDGQRSIPIGHNRVNRWFEQVANASAIGTMRGAIDRRNRLVMWAFSSVASTGQNNRILIYNWGADRWSHAVLDTQTLASFATAGYTLDTLDTILPGGIDNNSIPVDSPAYKGGTLGFAAVDASNRVSAFTGTPLDAQVDTKEFSALDFELPAGRRVTVTRVRPYVSATGAATVQVRMARRNGQADALSTFDTARSLNVSGEATPRVNARYHRARVLVSGNFDHVQGCEVEVTPGGKR